MTRNREISKYIPVVNEVRKGDDSKIYRKFIVNLSAYLLGNEHNPDSTQFELIDTHTSEEMSVSTICDLNFYPRMRTDGLDFVYVKTSNNLDKFVVLLSFVEFC